MAVQEVLGGELAWVADNDPGAADILAHRFPSVPNLGDLTAADWAAVEPVDVVIGGFPCQDISYAGRGEGIQEGNRSGLWYTIADALGILRPSLVVLENVAAIVGRRPGLDVVLSDLARLGFDAEWTCVRASDIGAPHQRSRWFAVCRSAANAEREPVRVRPGSMGAKAGSAEGSARQRERLRADPGDGRPDLADPAGVGKGEPADEALPVAAGGAPWPQPGGRNLRTAANAAGSRCNRGKDAGADRGNAGPGPRGVEPERDGGSRTDWGIYGPAIARWEAIFGRPAPRPTEPGPTGERLSPRLSEWMQGLPDGWVTDVPGLSRNAQLKALGNGVVPAQAAAALRLLLPVQAEAAA